MKQKLSVRVIIRQNNKILLARRLSGRESLRGFFELPGGEVAFGETPEISLQGQLQKNLNVNVQTLQLNGVYSEIDKENTSMQHVAIAYLASLINGPTLEPSHKYDKYVWRKMSEIQLNNLTSMSASILRLGETTQINSSDQNTYTNNDVEKTSFKKFIVYGDGGSRGNPGPSASGFVVLNEQEEPIFEGGKYLGITTNNQAEYQAVLLALEKAYELGAQEIECRLDSLLVVNQMNGVFKIKNRELWPIHSRIKEVVSLFHKVRFIHVRREFNTLADAMVNKILDQEATK